MSFSPTVPCWWSENGFQHHSLWTAPQLKLFQVRCNHWFGSLALPPFHPQGREVTSQHVLERIRRASVLERASEAPDGLTAVDRCRSDPDKSALIPPHRAPPLRRWWRRTLAKNMLQTLKLQIHINKAEEVHQATRWHLVDSAQT